MFFLSIQILFFNYHNYCYMIQSIDLLRYPKYRCLFVFFYLRSYHEHANIKTKFYYTLFQDLLTISYKVISFLSLKVISVNEALKFVTNQLA